MAEVVMDPVVIDTHVAGRPADLRDAASFLTDKLAVGITDLSDILWQRASLHSGWEGEAGAAVTERAAVLRRAAHEVSAAVAGLGIQLYALAWVLEAVQLGMGSVRAEAAAAGLTVRGDVILPRAAGPHAVESPDLPRTRAQTEAYEAAATRRAHLVSRWSNALTETRGFLEQSATGVAQLTRGLSVAGFSAALLARQAEVLAGHALAKLAEEQRLAVRRRASGRTVDVVAGRV